MKARPNFQPVARQKLLAQTIPLVRVFLENVPLHFTLLQQKNTHLTSSLPSPFHPNTIPSFPHQFYSNSLQNHSFSSFRLEPEIHQKIGSEARSTTNMLKRVGVPLYSCFTIRLTENDLSTFLSLKPQYSHKETLMRVWYLHRNRMTDFLFWFGTSSGAFYLDRRNEVLK